MYTATRGEDRRVLAVMEGLQTLRRVHGDLIDCQKWTLTPARTGSYEAANALASSKDTIWGYSEKEKKVKI